METQLSRFMKTHKEKLEAELRAIISAITAPDLLIQSMDYSLQAGGKRLRPMLLFATIAAFRQNPLIGMEAAAALEMIHTYSLIHDDLPSMDDDDLRRGKPTNHKVFGEATAILAGDALLTYAFQVVAQSKVYTNEQKVWLINWLSQAAGPAGMVGGQMADMEGENKRLALEELEYIHKHKTGKLLEFSVMAGAFLSGASEAQLQHFQTYANHIGLAFQIQDDILDVEGSEEKIGKRVGSDVNKHKSTYPALLTLAGAKEKLQEHVSEALQAIEQTNTNAELLKDLAHLIANRDQ
ncbi:polyprenyl synthetase family protein [Bacillus sp. REN10]|uniref:polyprenyl synthetase family protein n=1 Tax=Bacillus sp. REN10 TaxID=2782541 RepID=UPI00193C5F48|nr:farnesyl diphosphate synthase [Bacillus sp. REN10]